MAKNTVLQQLPDVNPTYPDYRGPDPDRSGYYESKAGTDFGAIGDIFEGVVKGTEAVIESDITETAYTEVDRARTEFGVDAVTSLQAWEPGKDVPQELGMYAQDVDRLTRAMRQGSLKYSHYLGRLDAISRQIRARYPGHRQFIDSTTQSITGTQPANAIVRQLFNESNEGLPPAQKQWNDLVEEGRRGGNLPPSFYDEGGNINQRWQDYNKLSAYVSTRNAQKANIDRANAKLTLDAAQGKAATSNAKSLAAYEINLGIGRVIEQGTSSVLGDSYKDFNAMLATATKGGTKPVSIAQQEELRNAFIPIKNALIQARDEKILEYQQWLGATEVNDLKAASDLFINNLEQKLINENFGALSLNKALIDTILNTDKSTALSGSDVLRRAVLVQDVGGDIGMFLWLNNTKTFDAFDAAISAIGLGDAVLDGEAAQEIFNKTSRNVQEGNSSSIDTAGAAPVNDAILNMLTTFLTDNTELPQENVSNIAKSLYGPGQENFLENISPENRAHYFGKLTTPKIVDKMYSLSQEGVPEAWSGFIDWTERSAFATYKPSANNIARYLNRTDSTWSVTWNPETEQFRAHSRARDALTQVGVFPKDALQSDVDRVNGLITKMKGIYGKQGPEDPAARTQDLLGRMGVDVQFGSIDEGDFPDAGNFGSRRQMASLGGQPTDPLVEYSVPPVQDSPPLPDRNPDRVLEATPADVEGARGGVPLPTRNPGVTPPPVPERHPFSGLPGVDGVSLTGATSKQKQDAMGVELMLDYSTQEGFKPVKNLLDFVTQGEAKSYNTIYGGSERPLDNMTIAEVYQLQNSMVRRNKVSSAVGKYQFIRKTLRSAVKALGLDINTTRFTSEVQDRLATYLLKIRGLDKFLEGKLSLEGFAKNLSKEWASLPRGQDNRSYYHGDRAGNRASVRWDAVLNQLQQLAQVSGGEDA